MEEYNGHFKCIPPSSISTRIFIIFFFFTFSSYAQNSRVWATYFGGPGFEEVWAMTADQSGNVYIAGTTRSRTGIAAGGFQDSLKGVYNAFLIKLDASGNRLWATYFGGYGGEYGLGVATDPSGNVYLAGQTWGSPSLGFNGFQNTFGGGVDAFLVKFNSAGTRIWSTYYGGSGGDYYSAVTTDRKGNVYLTGVTTSTSNIAFGGFQNTFSGGNQDNYLVKFSPNGTRLWATYYGGPGDEEASRVATDESGNVFMSSGTTSTTGIASAGFQNAYVGGNEEMYLVKFDSSGNRSWATYYGTMRDQFAYAVAADRSGNVYMAGETDSPSSIAAGGFQDTLQGYSGAFLVKFNPAGNRLWATYYGGAGNERAYGVITDKNNNVYLSGETGGYYENIASYGFQNIATGNYNDFLAKFDSSGSRLCATYFGQGNETNGYVGVDTLGNVYLAGGTASSSGIAYNGFQNTNAGNYDGFLVKFKTCCAQSPSNQITGLSSIYANDEDVLSASSGFATYSWSPFGQATQNITVAPSASTIYTVTMSNSNACTALEYFTINIRDGTISIPNIFTPNNDGNNDNFKFLCESIKELHCTIYDRWGKLMFEMKNSSEIWDGRNLSGYNCSDGVYYFILSAMDYNGNKINKQGFLELLR